MTRLAEKTIRVLMVEDDDDDALLTSSALVDLAWGRFDVAHAKTLGAALEIVASCAIDVVLLDLSLPDSRGLDTLIAVRDKAVNVPVVVLTGWADEHTAIEALNHGAQDYLVKGTLSGDAMTRSVRHAIERQRLVTSLQGANELLSQKNARLAELCETAHRFVDNVSHEFRTPLTVIKEFASLLHDGLYGPLSPEQLNAAQVVCDRTDDLTCLVHDMMDVSRLKAGLLCMRRRPTRLSEVVERVRPMLERRAARAGSRLDVEISSDLPLVYCDGGKVGQIVTNLVINAVKFSGENALVRLWARDNGAHLVVGVSDNGPGIEPDKLQLIFERFTQLNHDIASSTKGIGLGLAIVKEFVSLNLGDISVESAPGFGSTFSFTLPRADLGTVVDCYLRRLQIREPADAVSVLEAKVGGTFDPAVCPVVDECLQRTISPEDLAFMSAPGHWMILSSCLQGAESDALERIDRAWSDECRNWIYGTPPEVWVNSRGRWTLDCADELRRVVASCSQGPLQQGTELCTV